MSKIYSINFSINVFLQFREKLGDEWERFISFSDHPNDTEDYIIHAISADQATWEAIKVTVKMLEWDRQYQWLLRMKRKKAQHVLSKWIKVLAKDYRRNAGRGLRTLDKHDGPFHNF